MNPSEGPLRPEDLFCFAVYSTAHAVMRRYRPLLDALGLTYPQYLVMLVLWAEQRETVGGLADRLLLDSSTITPLLKRLESQGLIHRRRNPANERQLIVSLTEAGRVLQEKAAEIPAAILCASGTTIPQLSRLRDEMVEIRAAFSASLGPDVPPQEGSEGGERG